MRHPPYHLRLNKAVDRLLLVDTLTPLNPDEDCTYYSFAGPFLEDLRVMDHFFPKMKLTSLEIDAETYSRQKFHQFSSRLVLKHCSLTQFLANDYQPGVRDIFWLDYTGLRFSYFDEFQVVLKSVPAGSVIRITLRAQSQIDFRWLHEHVSADEVSNVWFQLQARFEDEFAQVLAHPPFDVSKPKREFALAVQSMVRRAASSALDVPGSPVDFLHLHTTRYDDGTQMVSVTGIVVPRDALAQYRQLLADVRFVDFEWQDVHEIAVPMLTIKECLHLESHIPLPPQVVPGTSLYPVLNYSIARGVGDSVNQLTQYAQHHRDYPRFVRSSL